MRNIDNDEIEEEDTETDGSPQKVYHEPKTSAGPNYPDEDAPLDKAKPKTVNLGENPPPIIKKRQMFWEVEDEDETPVTKGEMKKFEQMFWDESKKREELFWESKKNQMFWDETDPVKKSENLVQNAQSELKKEFGKMESGPSLNYKEELDRLISNPQGYTASQRQNVVDNAFGEIAAAFVKGGILSKAQAHQELQANIKSNRGSFFRGKRER